jgi:hypothetical protein
LFIGLILFNIGGIRILKRRNSECLEKIEMLLCSDGVKHSRMIQDRLGISGIRVFQLIVLVVVIVAVVQGMNYEDRKAEPPSEGIEVEEMTHTDYLGTVYVYQLLDNERVELNLVDGYESIEYSANIYYTDNMGLQSGTLGGGSSSKAKDMD